MKSIISSAVLGAAVVAAASVHNHGHVHRRAPAASPAAVEKRATAFLSSADATSLTTKGFLTGKNIAAGTNAGAVTVGGSGPFLVEFDNQAEEDIVVVCWSGVGQWGAVAATFVGAVQPDITHTLASNTTATVSYDPAQNGGSISGACGAVYPSTDLTSFSGQLGNTWKEFTYTTENEFSTTDVSRLVNMSGNKMTVENYASKTDATPACTADYERCSFQCAAGVNNCIAGSMPDCPVTAGTTSDASGSDGGCGGLTAAGGYVRVTFL